MKYKQLMINILFWNILGGAFLFFGYILSEIALIILRGCNV